MELSNLERTNNSSEYENLIQTIKEHCLEKYKVNLVEENTAPRTCIAIDAQGEFITHGSGKGAHARVGAFGECLEHFHLLHTGQNAHRYSDLVSKENLYLGDIYTRTGSRLSHDKSHLYATKYQIFKSSEHTFLPNCLINIDSMKEGESLSEFEIFHTRYATTSGTAFGFSFSDALLHAVLEILERDEISKLYLNLLGRYGDGVPYHMVSDYSIHPEIEDVNNRLMNLGSVERTETLVRKTEYGTYFSITILRHTNSSGKSIVTWGAGCSLYAKVAIYRSLTECEQMACTDMPKDDDRVSELAAKFPDFKSIEKFDLEKIAIVNSSLRFEDTPKISTEDQLDYLQKTIRESGREVLVFEHDCFTSLYHVVSAYISDMEKFFGIVFALPLVPIPHLRKHEVNPPH